MPTPWFNPSHRQCVDNSRVHHLMNSMSCPLTVHYRSSGDQGQPTQQLEIPMEYLALEGDMFGGLRFANSCFSHADLEYLAIHDSRGEKQRLI